MRLVVLSVFPERVAQYSHHWDHFEWEVFTPSIAGIKQGLTQLAAKACTDKWNESVVFIQDDIKPPAVFSPHVGEVTSYSREVEGHCCPRAISASFEGWVRLYNGWQRGHTKACYLWKPDHIYDEVTHLEPSKNASARHRDQVWFAKELIK